MSYLELFQQGPAVYIPVLLFSLVITVVAYGAFPFIFAKTRKAPITKKKYRVLCYGVNVAVMFLFIIMNGESSSGGPYLLWTWVFSRWGEEILCARGKMPDDEHLANNPNRVVACKTCGYRDKNYFDACPRCGKYAKKYVLPTQAPPAPPTPPAPPAQIRFCRKCGEKLIECSQFCHKCGTNITKP